MAVVLKTCVAGRTARLPDPRAEISQSGEAMKALVSYKALLNIFCFSVDLIIVDELSLPRNIQGESQGTLGKREVNSPLKMRVFISFSGSMSEL